MVKKTVTLGSFATLILGCLGCHGASVSFNVDDHHPQPRVYVDTPAVHVCTYDCNDHYWNGHTLVSLHGHRHGPGCGHHFDNGRWGVSFSLGSAKIRLGAGHVCDRNCHDHYWNGTTTVRLSSHRHIRGCGHVFKSGHWIAKGKHHPKAKHHSYKSKSHKGKSYKDPSHKGKSYKSKSYKGKSYKGKSKKSKAKGKYKSKGHARP